jgi:uncharacterized protein (TIGR00369 family)
MSAPSGPSAGNGSAPVYGNVSRETLKSTKGIDLLQGMIDGRYPAPPIAGLMDFGLTELAPGRAVFAGRPGKQHYNPSGTVHGGFAATLLDSAMGCAVHTLVPQGQGFTTLEIKVNYVRPMFDTTGEIRCEAAVINMGKTVATADGKVLDANGRLIAHGTTTCLIFDIP